MKLAALKNAPSKYIDGIKSKLVEKARGAMRPCASDIVDIVGVIAGDPVLGEPEDVDGESLASTVMTLRDSFQRFSEAVESSDALCLALREDFEEIKAEAIIRKYNSFEEVDRIDGDFLRQLSIEGHGEPEEGTPQLMLSFVRAKAAAFQVASLINDQQLRTEHIALIELLQDEMVVDLLVCEDTVMSEVGVAGLIDEVGARAKSLLFSR